MTDSVRIVVTAQDSTNNTVLPLSLELPERRVANNFFVGSGDSGDAGTFSYLGGVRENNSSYFIIRRLDTDDQSISWAGDKNNSTYTSVGDLFDDIDTINYAGSLYDATSLFDQA